MTKLVVALACATFMSSSFAQSVPPVQEITKKIINSVTGYANAIACSGVKVDPKQIAALVPYKTMDDRETAKYAVLWSGDIGCAGGSGTEGTNIAIVTVGAGDSFVVDPLHSSPVIEFHSVDARGISKIVGNTADSLVLDGLEYDPNGKDAMCCPSVPVRVTVRVDEKGNWKVVEKKSRKAKK